MRVRAIATASTEANAIGSVEFECSPIGLAIGLFGVGAYQDGYAPGRLAQGTRITVPYSAITRVVSAQDGLHLDLSYPGFPHDRLHLTRFSVGAGVPLDELRRRRMILHVVAGSLAVSAAVAAAVLSPALPTETIGIGALAYAALAATVTLGLGFALDRRFFAQPPGAAAVQAAFARDLAQYVGGGVRRLDANLASPKRPEEPTLAGWLPRAAALVGLVVAAVVLTALVSGQRLLVRERAQAEFAAQGPRRPEPSRPDRTTAPSSGAPARPLVPTDGLAKDHGSSETEATSATSRAPSADSLTPLKRCLCDRADSQLWREPIPVLSALLLEKRSVPRKSHLRLELEVAVVNNGDTPIDDLTIHVQFAERPLGGEARHTAERPLFYEGPLQPGQAIKWSTEARGTEFEIQAPDLGVLGPNGEGAAPADAFNELLLEANHRPVRLHAARLLSYLGDQRGRAGALKLRDALRAAEGPYLRRVLSATDDVRVCDVDRQLGSEVGLCVYNAGDEERSGLGIAVTALHGTLDTNHPLAHPPEITAVRKWKVAAALPAQAGVYVRAPLEAGFLPNAEHTVEVTADRFDLLD